jgi:transposase
MTSYNKEFRVQAVKLAKDLGSALKAANQLGVAPPTIYSWMKMYPDVSGTKAKSDQKASDTDLENENERLRREIAELKKVNYILKSAAAFFSQDHLK